VGKTRLAVEPARTVEADFADRAGFVPLASVGRTEDVAGAIMGVLAIVPLAGESVADAVERFLAVKHLLLVSIPRPEDTSASQHSLSRRD
jgi:predicted ATPase